MSIEIDWTKLTTGPDGLALAESVREFIHDKFQKVSLPGFIRSVEVHSFEFGEECPSVVIKDICDPLPDFYTDEDENDDVEDGEEGEEVAKRPVGAPGVLNSAASLKPQEPLKERGVATQRQSGGSATEFSRPLPYVDTHLPRIQSNLGLGGHIASPLLSRSSTPGIPGGTSNLSYFHLPLSARLSGAQTPLAAMASGSGWHEYYVHPWEHHHHTSSPMQQQVQGQDFSHGDPSTRPSTAHSYGQSQDHAGRSSFGETDSQNLPEPDPNDLQIVLHISYSGNIRLSLTAEILLNYPMPSFVGIPLKLNITGLSFDGVALIAHLKKRAHFCFLGQEDAEMLVGAENTLNEDGDGLDRKSKAKMGGLFKEIRVESEIGQKDGGKQVLKNVGKVEKFVLEQVRRIFEEEMVWPSYWTFLV